MKGLTIAAALTALFLMAINAKAQTFDANGNGTQIIAKGAPPGCPFRRFCGCALAKFLGISDKRLNLAWNWARLYPRTDARPGAAAVRPGHVMLLVSQVSQGHWVVRDYNSGGGLSRIHVRSIRGFVFVNPSTQRVAGG